MGITSRLFMLFVTLLALEQPMTILTSLPGHFRALGRKPTTCARTPAPMLFLMIVGFLARMAIVNAGEKFRHLGDDVIMVVVHVQVNLLLFLWTSIDDFIAVFFRDDTDLVIGKVGLKLFSFFNSARTKRHAGVLMEFLCQTRLQWSMGISYLTVASILIDLGFGHYEGSRHT